MRIKVHIRHRGAKLQRRHEKSVGRTKGGDLYNWRNAHKPRPLFSRLGIVPPMAKRRPKQLLRAALRRRVRRHGDARLRVEVAVRTIQLFVRRTRLRRLAKLLAFTAICACAAAVAARAERARCVTG